MRRQRPWYSPEGWLVSLLYTLGTGLPGDARLLFAVAYGLVDCIGIKGTIQSSFKIYKFIRESKRGQHSQNTGGTGEQIEPTPSDSDRDQRQ